MASSNDSLSPLAERLLSRSGSGPRIGAGSRLFERLGLQNPYQGGAIADQSLGEDRFSFLSSEAYFSELRGLSYFRSQLLGRIGRVRSSIRAHERFDRTVGTVATRALRLGLPEALEPTLVDWSTQLDSTESPSDELSDKPRERPERRQTAAERALRGEISSASKVLEQLERVASMSRNSASRKVKEQLANLSQLSPLEQADAAQRLAGELRGVAAIAARNTDLARTGRGSERNGERALSVAQRRQNGPDSRGLQRVLDQSPVVMELERPVDHPSAEGVSVAARRPRSASVPARNHREVPVARAATEARSQASVGRAGPPADAPVSFDETVPSAVRPPLRPTARVARTARKATNAPLFDTRRGLRHDDAPMADAGPAERLAQRMHAGVVSTQGSVVPGVSWARQPLAPAQHAGHALVEGAPSAEVVHAAQVDAAEPGAVASRVGTKSAARPGASKSAARPGASRSVARPGPSKSVARRAVASERAVATHVPALARAMSRPIVDSTASTISAARPRTLQVGDSRESRPLVRTQQVGGLRTAGVAGMRTVGELLNLDDREIEPVQRAERSSKPVVALGADELRMAAPATTETDGVSTPAASRRPSALENVVASGSRRNRVQPTVRAASRALAQERSGARGRLLAPSATAHVTVATPQRALSTQPVVASVSGILPSTRASGASDSIVERLQDRAERDRAVLSQGPAAVLSQDRAGLSQDRAGLSQDRAGLSQGRQVGRSQDATMLSQERAALSEEETSVSARADERSDGLVSEQELRTSRTVASEADLVFAAATDAQDVHLEDGVVAQRRSQSVSDRAAPTARLANSSRAVARAVSRERTGETGSMLSPRSVAPFRQEASVPVGRAQDAGRRTMERTHLGSEATSSSPRSAIVDSLAERTVVLRPSDPTGLTTEGDAPRREASTNRPVAQRVARMATPEAEMAILARSGRVASPTELTLARSTDDTASTEPTGLASRASRRGREVAEVARRTITQPITPEQQQSVARRAVSSAMERSQTHRTPDGQFDPASSGRTAASETARSSTLRTPDSVFANARSVRTEGAESTPARVRRTPGSNTETTAAIRGQRGFMTPARVVRTSGTMDPSSMRWRTGAGRFDAASVTSPTSRSAQANAASFITPTSRTLEPAAVAAARRQDPAALAGRSVAPQLDPVLLDSVFDSTLETPVAETGLGRAMRRFDQGREQVGALPAMGPADLVLAQSLDHAGTDVPSASDVPRARPTSHALARTTTRREASSQVARPTPSDRTAHATMQLVNQPGLVDGVLVSGGEAVEHESIAGGRGRLHRTPSTPSRSRMRSALDASAAKGRAVSSKSMARGFEFAMPSSSDRSSGAAAALEARLDVAHDGTLLGAVVSDASGNESVRRRFAERAEPSQNTKGSSPMEARRHARSTRLADDSFVPLTPTMVAQGLVDDSPLGRQDARGMTSTLDALVRPPVPQAGGQQPLLRRRAWNRRSMAVDLGVQTPTLAGADFVPEDQRLDGAPAWARRAGKGTSAQTASMLDVARPERETNGLMGALARAERPDEIVKVIIDRRTEIREVRGELPQEAVRLMQRISEFSGAEADLLRSGQRVMAAAPEQNMLQSRSMKGGADITQLSAGTNGLGATRVMKLADKLMGLIHLAENSRQKDAQDQVRMAQDSLEARAEGGAKFPGLSVEDHDMNIEQLRKSVLESVMEAFEDKEQRSPGEQDGGKRWF